ncbi:GL20156 [Drosophila persimilis]|uniref:GL20156 n=1 Tax=Drosophila persimilis TaxID=7234 RepID=B4GY28_DROPE|nr:GL20156 [Drosophila persimilis]
MVYIDRNGRVCEKRPWDGPRIVELFLRIWYIIKQLFLTFLAPFAGKSNNDNRRAAGSGWGCCGGCGRRCR